eukprot:1138321-Prorocentrum_minimum.AAC.1
MKSLGCYDRVCKTCPALNNKNLTPVEWFQILKRIFGDSEPGAKPQGWPTHWMEKECAHYTTHNTQCVAYYTYKAPPATTKAPATAEAQRVTELRRELEQAEEALLKSKDEQEAEEYYAQHVQKCTQVL